MINFRNDTTRRRGITMIEMLLVVVILGLGVSLSTWSLSRVADDAVRSTLSFRWHTFDTNARILAQRSGKIVVIKRNAISGAVTAHGAWVGQSQFETDRQVLRFDLKVGRIVSDVRLFTSTGRFALEGVVIDRTGTSADYDVEFTLDRSDAEMDPRLVRVRVHGLTGMVEEIK